MKTIVIILFLISSQINVTQIDTLYLFIEKPIFGYRCEENIGTGFLLKNTDKKKPTDYFSFEIQNAKGLKENGGFDYYTLKELRKEISIQELNYETIQSLSKNKKWWEIHNELSQKREIYLLEKRKEGFNSQTGNYEYKYYILPMIYEGTRKIIVPTDLSKKP